MHGPFVSYPEGDLPVVTDVEGLPVRPDVIRLSWAIRSSSDCYTFIGVSINCGTEIASEGEGKVNY